MRENLDQYKIWGGSEIRLKPTYLAYLRLKYTLDDLKEVEGKVLDAGCGGGGFAKAVKYYRDDLDVYGADINTGAIAHAKRNSMGVKFEVGDLYSLPYKDSFFDAVIVEDVLEHLEHPPKALDEINRVLKRGGVFSAFVPLEGSVFSLHFCLEKLGWRSKEKLAGHIQKFNKSKLKSKFKDFGFKVEKERYSVHLLGQLVDVVFFTVMDWLGKKLEVGLEENLKDKQVKRFFKDIITKLTNLESQILNFISSETNLFIPGAGIHIKAIKK